MRVGVAVVLSLLITVGCAKPRVASPTVATPGSAHLRDELASVFDDPTVNALWAVEVQSFDTGEVLFQRNAHTLVMPASNMKILTMAVAAERLGWDFRFTTELATQGTIANGVLTGDLIVVGSGDPTISDRDGDRLRIFESWADQLRAAGITRIDGRIVGDDNLFDDQPLGDGWSWDDLTTSSAPPGGALQFNEDLVRVIITPATAPGQPATVRLDPDDSGMTVRSAVLTVESKVPQELSISRKLGSTTIEIEGVVPVNAGEVVRLTPVENPTIFFVNALRATLIRKGISVTGPAVDIDDIPAATGATASATRNVLVTHRSPPLSEIGKTFMKVSQNLFGETLMATLGVRSGGAGVPTHPRVEDGHLTYVFRIVEAARKVYDDVLAGWGIPQTEYILADGSGLSRYNYVTPHLLIQILRRMTLDPTHQTTFEAALPIAGKDGTLSRRMNGTRSEDNVHAKTGTLSAVRALSGYVRTLDGERIGFSIIANNFKAPTPAVDAIAELAVERLANFTRKSVAP
jgi:serine-type D-Ala-D-Ala carboxypeptidase/endopeptidase (penicillin-binding protein 4)